MDCGDRGRVPYGLLVVVDKHAALRHAVQGKESPLPVFAMKETALTLMQRRAQNGEGDILGESTTSRAEGASATKIQSRVCQHGGQKQLPRR